MINSKEIDSGDVLSLRDVLAADHADPSSLTSNLHFHYDRASGNTMVEVKFAGDATLDQKIVLSGVDMTSDGSLNDAEVIQLLLTQGRLPIDQ